MIVHPKVRGPDLDQLEYVYDLRNLPLSVENLSRADLQELLSKYSLRGPEDNPRLTLSK